MRKALIGVSLAAVGLVAAPARAHHGKDFLVVETVELPHRGQLFFFSSQDVVREDGHSAVQVSPALLWGFSRVVALEVHSHLAREAGAWRYEATAPALRIRLPSAGAFEFGLAAEYEVAHEAEAHDHLEGRVVMSYRRGDAALVINLVAEDAAGSDEPTELGYAAGVRPNLGGRLGWGIEAQGVLRGEAAHEVLVYAGQWQESAERTPAASAWQACPAGELSPGSQHRPGTETAARNAISTRMHEHRRATGATNATRSRSSGRVIGRLIQHRPSAARFGLRAEFD